MNRTPPKRTASRSPENGRAHKRLATSSPEEGEVDDETHNDVPHAERTPPPVTPTRPASKFATKVAFPFKKKNGAEASLPPRPTVGMEDATAAAAVIYERSAEDERRIREKEQQRKQWPSHPDNRRTGGADHWEPSREYRDKERRGTHEHHSSSKSRRDRLDRSRGRSSPSPSRSSPSSTSTRRGKHRLPAHHDRTPPYAFSPPRREYNIDRLRDNRERDDVRHRREDHYDRGSYYHPRDPDRYNDRGDGYWRAPVSPRLDYDRRDDYDHRDSYGSRRRDLGTYRPSSPGPSTRTASASVYPPRSPSPTGPHTPSPINGPRTPPPPSDPPPPPPPATEDVHPLAHPTISIPLPRKPAAPVNVHSPTPMILPPATTPAFQRDQERGEVKEIKKREPVRRSRKEEFEAYGRTFEGCGMQGDYDVTTKLGEGTFGEVHKAIHKITHRVVALKRILMHNEKEGMPVTALREIKILKALKHPCIVDILDMFVVRSKGKDSSLSVYMVFPYMDHDLAGLLENERVKLQPSHIKLYMKQLLEGTEYMHRNRILHRDMKAANLLISNDGTLRIADFGLARAYDPAAGRGTDGKERKYTNCVVTRWYRPPELLLGARQYGGEVDLWGIGCVLGEMFMRKPILPGATDVDQLEKIWMLCGTPNQHTWPNYDGLPGCEGIKRFATHSRRLKQNFETIGPETCDLLDKLLTCNPSDRITATDALDHDYFWTDPLPADPKTLPSYEASHEFDKRSRRVMPQGNPHMPHDGPHRAPQIQPPFMNRPPPTRESFHNGPPRGPMHPGPLPQHPRPPYMPPRGYPPNGSFPPGGPHTGPGPPFRPGDRRDQARERPGHLPAKPGGGPLGRGGGTNRGSWRGGLTGGDGGRPVNGSGSGGLPYE